MSQANRVPGLKEQAPFDGLCLTCARLEYEHVAVEAHSHEKGGARFHLDDIALCNFVEFDSICLAKRKI